MASNNPERKIDQQEETEVAEKESGFDLKGIFRHGLKAGFF
jgi:hypothetical protein